MNDKKYILTLILIIALIFGLVFYFTGKNMEEYKEQYTYFNSFQEIRIYTKDEKKAKELFAFIDETLKEYDILTSRTVRKDYNLYAINHDDKIMTINEKLYKLIEYGLKVKEETKGIINISSGKISDAYKDFQKTKIKPNYKNIKFNEVKLSNNNQIDTTDINLDLSTITRFYVGNIIKEKFKNEGIESYIINFGGSAIVGLNPNRYFSLAIEKPYSEGKETIQILNINDKTVVTVGNYQNYFTIDETNYSAIINPVTLTESKYNQSVSVISEDPLEAEMLAYTLVHKTIQEGNNVLEYYPSSAAIWYTNDGKVEYSKKAIQYKPEE